MISALVGLVLASLSNRRTPDLHMKFVCFYSFSSDLHMKFVCFNLPACSEAGRSAYSALDACESVKTMDLLDCPLSAGFLR